jgi:hypothetical protein
MSHFRPGTLVKLKVEKRWMMFDAEGRAAGINNYPPGKTFMVEETKTWHRYRCLSDGLYAQVSVNYTYNEELFELVR